MRGYLILFAFVAIIAGSVWGWGSAAAQTTPTARPGSPANPPRPTQGSGSIPHVQLNPTEASTPALVTITGAFNYIQPIRARRVVVDTATITCAPGQSLQIDAATIEWRGATSLVCHGQQGDRGRDGEDWTNRGWCKGMDVNNAEADYINGGNEAGGNGTNGTAGTAGSSILIRAARHEFLTDATLTVDTRGGRGGAQGRGGQGRSKCRAPSGDDCAHGTNLFDCRHAPNGVDGALGPDGASGTFTLTGDVGAGTPRITRVETPALYP